MGLSNVKAKSMLSKVELEFLKSPESFGADYSRVLRHRIKVKRAQLREESVLFGEKVNVTENCNVTEFCNGKQSPNQAAFSNLWSLRRDLDPRPLPYQGNAPPG
jgi:hypothetical protein